MSMLPAEETSPVALGARRLWSRLRCIAQRTVGEDVKVCRLFSPIIPTYLVGTTVKTMISADKRQIRADTISIACSASSLFVDLQLNGQISDEIEQARLQRQLEYNNPNSPHEESAIRWKAFMFNEGEITK